ncbi:MAG: SEC-C metal-binding domain-containing protein [Cyclonatronaceae bacterium]
MAVKINRNDPCHCGSGKKYKNCCHDKDNARIFSKLGLIGLAILLIVGLVVVWLSLAGGEGVPSCPAGTVWSDAHQHCH